MKRIWQNGHDLTSTTIRLTSRDRQRISRIQDCYQDGAGTNVSMARIISMGLRALEREIVSGRGFLALEEM
ncbi:hypothetical protein DPQ33_09850 [Oceanidesulfovibrio indonesiensis]|uniref:Uncharacterized protein n=1 Tax=Oceanidesulfovibrio indonesiensis TaxID=54767 RepID=A0A7M3MF81_9BACT|nr:hypothetical protein [Oceanidesulfovibrio indonesiensis]TVM17093.1 hypothetical protein DPQ33_09850 [Oceanidesulfovibrio indonesiensis]